MCCHSKWNKYQEETNTTYVDVHVCVRVKDVCVCICIYIGGYVCVWMNESMFIRKFISFTINCLDFIQCSTEYKLKGFANQICFFVVHAVFFPPFNVLNN